MSEPKNETAEFAPPVLLQALRIEFELELELKLKF